MLGVPFVSGMVLGRWVRARQTLQVVCALSLLAGLVMTAVLAELAGLLCGLIAGVIVGGPLVLGVLAGSLAYGRSSDGRTAACVAVVAALLPLEGQLPRTDVEERVVTTMAVPVDSFRAFERFRFYEGATGEPERLLTLVLPRPVRTEPVAGAGGSLVRCVYESGHLVKEVVRSVPGRVIDFRIVEQEGVEDRSVALTRGSVRFDALGPDSTRITMTTYYRPLLTARVLWRPFEIAVVRALHRHVVRAITRAGETTGRRAGVPQEFRTRSERVRGRPHARIQRAQLGLVLASRDPSRRRGPGGPGMIDRRRALFLSHGGGPLPLLGDDAHAEMVSCLREIAATIDRPSAIIVVSAHWETAGASVTSGARPELIYDYYGFPPEAYEITYPCPGEPGLARAIRGALDAAGIAGSADESRGFDHGLFVPLKLLYPEGDIPCVQVSLVSSLDPAAHIEMGRALRRLADPSVLLIGSGFSFHNMQAFFAPETAESQAANAAFERWLHDTCSDERISEEERAERLVQWQAAPSARYCHPREEHLLPLHVCYGYAGSACSRAYALRILGKDASMLFWEARGG